MLTFFLTCFWDVWNIRLYHMVDCLEFIFIRSSYHFLLMDPNGLLWDGSIMVNPRMKEWATRQRGGLHLDDGNTHRPPAAQWRCPSHWIWHQRRAHAPVRALCRRRWCQPERSLRFHRIHLWTWRNKNSVLGAPAAWNGGWLGASKSTKGTYPATKVLAMHLKHLVLSGLEDDKT